MEIGYFVYDGQPTIMIADNIEAFWEGEVIGNDVHMVTSDTSADIFSPPDELLNLEADSADEKKWCRRHADIDTMGQFFDRLDEQTVFKKELLVKLIMEAKIYRG